MKKVFSPFVLSPLVLGLGAGAVFWFALSQKPMGQFLIVAGLLGAGGSLLTLLLAGGKSVPAAQVRRRQEMIDGLAELLDTSRFTATTESDRPAAAAQPERA